MCADVTSRTIALIVKATRSCNLRCAYCNDWRPGSGNAMPFEVLARLVEAALTDPHHDAVRFSWHGGEPTLLGQKYFEKAMLLQSGFRRAGQRVTNSIMTNATRITDEWAQFLKDNEFSVGVSLDGPREIHDTYRRDAAGRPSFDATRRGIQRLHDLQVGFGITVVLDRAGYELGPVRLFDFLVGEGITSFGINFVMPPFGAPTDVARQHYITTQDRAAFLRGLHERWKDYGDRAIKIRELDALRRRVAGRHGGPCTLTGSCWSSLYSVEPNGDVAHCDFFLGSDEYVWGNIMRQDFSSIRTSPSLVAARQRHNRAAIPKQQCPEYSVCNGGCPHEYLMSQTYDPLHREECCGLDELIETLRADLDGHAAVEPVPLGLPRAT